MTDFIEFIWGNKIYQIENIDIEYVFDKIKNYPQHIQIQLTSTDLLKELRQVKLQRILENTSNQCKSPIILKSPIYYCSYNKEGFLIIKLLIKPKDIIVDKKTIHILSDFWADQYV